MAITFILLSLAAYFGFCIDWKEFIGVMREGGWASIVLYIVLTILIYSTIVAPKVAATIGSHH
mgnify:CR=1 FL=1